MGSRSGGTGVNEIEIAGLHTMWRKHALGVDPSDILGTTDLDHLALETVEVFDV